MLNLRTKEGLNLSLYQDLFNKDLYINKREIIDSYIKSGHLILLNDCLIPTFEGMMILDKITLDLFN